MATVKERYANMSWNRGNGKGIKFLHSLIGHAGSDCIPWPLSRDRNGYGQCAFEGKVIGAARLMCVLAHGEPPSPAHEAAHLCGNGHNGCVNPNHLCWKTPAANASDMVAHGRARQKGTPRRILTAEQAAEIRRLGKTMPHTVLAEQFRVNRRTVRQIVVGRDRPDRPLRHGARYPAEQRERMIATAKSMRAAGATYYKIAEVIGCSRCTAKAYAQMSR